MIMVGLTGSIGMGKTTTSKMFEALGAAVFDADMAVHEIYAKGGSAVPIIKAGIPEAVIDGAVDRAALSKALAKDPLLFPVLESFVHPLIAQSREAAQADAKHKGLEVFINDVPLLFETGMDANMDKIIVVSAAAQVQRKRVLEREGMSAEKFESILARQMPDSEKRKRADYVILTDRGMDFAREQVQLIMRELTE